ncbi:MAG TPA: PIG-L family deacetylase, partial [Longimicrobiales bacterium]
MRYRRLSAVAVVLALAACARPHADAGSAPAPADAPVVARDAGRAPAILFDPALRLPAPDVEYRGAAALGLALRRLGPTQRVLMIGAHPDDENTALLAELALGRGADVAYLSLTRGEGGQNLIGPELDEALGLIRTEELLAARRLDGAVQFFTRAYDYGFSRSADEAFQHWPHDSILSDVVAVVRAWKPDVIISQFTGTPRDGHGQHQAAGILAREAFSAAADPGRFPAQVAAGLAPHETARFYQSWYRTPEGRDDLIALETGDLDPLFGRSRFQIAMASRSRHRSQDMGRAESMGPQQYTLSAVAPGPELTGLGDVFEGVPHRLHDRSFSPSGDPIPEYISGPLGRYERSVRQSLSVFSPDSIREVARALQDAVSALDEAYASANAWGGAPLRFHIALERADAARAALLAMGVQLDVTADRARVHPGDTITLELALWNGGSSELPVLRLEPDLPEGWWAQTDDAPVTSIAPGQVARRTFRVHLPHDAPVDVPYFLAQPRAAGADMYEWPADYDVRGRAFEPSLLRGVAVVANWLPVEDAAEFVEVDPARGELREPVLVLPGATVDAEPDVVVVPLDARGRP